MGNLDYKHKLFARALRVESTQTEKMVWEVLRNRQFMNLKFRRQHCIKNYVVDFYCDELKLVVEIDGKIHEKLKDYDQFRQELIEYHGYRFIRVTNEEVRKDIIILFQKINQYLNNPRPTK